MKKILLIIASFLSCFLNYNGMMLLFFILFYLFHNNNNKFPIIIGMAVYCAILDPLSITKNFLFIVLILFIKEVLKNTLNIKNFKTSSLIFVSLVLFLLIVLNVEKLDFNFLDFLNIFYTIGIVYFIYWCIIWVFKRKSAVKKWKSQVYF